jgi:acyl-CoA thioesterase-2
VTLEELLGIDGDRVVPGEGWGNQWGATFGGYVAGVALHALERAAPPEQVLSVAHVVFVQPLRTHEARLEVEIHRSGGSATSLGVRLQQDGAPAALATAWTSAEIAQGGRVDVPRPEAGPPAEYEPRLAEDDQVGFVDREFEIRPVPTSADGTAALQWMRLTRVEIGDDDPWPAAALGIVADMVGAGQFRAARLALGEPHALLSLDLTLHLVDRARGPWLLGAFDNVALGNGRVVGRGELYDERGAFVASVTQQSLVRPFR